MSIDKFCVGKSKSRMNYIGGSHLWSEKEGVFIDKVGRREFSIIEWVREGVVIH